MDPRAPRPIPRFAVGQSLTKSIESSAVAQWRSVGSVRVVSGQVVSVVFLVGVYWCVIYCALLCTACTVLGALFYLQCRKAHFAGQLP